MRRRPLMLLCLFALAFAAASCAKLPGPPPLTRGPLQVEQARYADAIPLDYGTLIAVTTDAESPYMAGLWFEKPDKTIVYVKVNVSLGKIHNEVLVLPRR
jgi:hypothetical protein